ncbi:MAG TPA: ribbon-helix-helix domain-containing protein [Burkholderiaceae bacterium]|nr:ribbon-helix-helix domain-containing protein [Burkholderiaceae bacterium]
MCHIYSHTDPIMYESRTRSVRISKVVTSIKLENLFWDTLAAIAQENNVTTNELIAELHDEVYAFRGETPNFASFLRVTCMRYLEIKAQPARSTAPHVLPWRPRTANTVSSATSSGVAARCGTRAVRETSI